jgi:hypothetical protein
MNFRFAGLFSGPGGTDSPFALVNTHRLVAVLNPVDSIWRELLLLAFL